MTIKSVCRAGGTIALVLAAATAQAAPAAPAADYTSIVKSYFDHEEAAYPVAATSLGLHAGDARLDDQSARAHGIEAHRLHATLDQLAQVDTSHLTASERDDRDVLQAEIGGQLLEEERVQQWRHNPDAYVGLATQAPYTLIARNFAPAAQRLQSVIAREKQIPGLFAVARQNLTAIPAPWLEIGLENVAGAIDFIGHDVPAAFNGVKDKKTQAALSAATKTAIAAARDFQSWLGRQKATAQGSFVYGADNFRRLLAADMIDLKADDVLAAGRAQLKRDQDAFAATSRLVDPKNPSDALKIIEQDHPDAAHLISTARGQLADLRAFIVSHKIVDLPGTDLPTVAETPAFQRALIFGEMDPPGPFEQHAIQAYYYITPPDLAKPKAEQEEYLAYFNRPLLLNLTVHEALPGHFVQYLYARANPNWSLVRKTGHSYTATEGWAHYSEQMMPAEGLGNGDPKLRLAQLQDALLRDCRLIGSVEMHTHGMSLADATTMMAKECFQPKPVAYKEARRGTSDPGYFSYTLGKLMILKLRADVQTKEGPAFSLAHFHDRFLAASTVPLKVIRREILGVDGPLL
ncbi:MAG: DUF885 domain-containing protein [Rhodospirillales bacterium]